MTELVDRARPWEMQIAEEGAHENFGYVEYLALPKTDFAEDGHVLHSLLLLKVDDQRRVWKTGSPDATKLVKIIDQLCE